MSQAYDAAPMATLVFLHPARPGLHADPTGEELAAITAHAAYMAQLVRDGVVSLAGPCEDGSLGIVVFPQLDVEQATEHMRGDPCVTAGVMSFEARPLRLTFAGTGTRRDWLGFTQAVHVHASQAAVWRLISTCEGLERWFLTRAEAFTSDGRPWPRDRVLEPEQKLRLVWKTPGECDARGACVPTEVKEDDVVLAVEAPQRLRISWYQDRGWVDIRLLPRRDGRLTVELQQRMHHTRDFPFLERVYVGCRQGWTFFLANLKSVAEGGADLREQAPDRNDLINC